MRVLLDHCVHARLARLLTRCEVRTAAQQGWEELRNGDLLAQAAAAGFDVFLTTDQNVRHQHNHSTLPLAVVEIVTRDTRFRALQAFGPFLAEALASTARHRFVSVGTGGVIERLAERPTPGRTGPADQA